LPEITFPLSSSVTLCGISCRSLLLIAAGSQSFTRFSTDDMIELNEFVLERRIKMVRAMLGFFTIGLILSSAAFSTPAQSAGMVTKKTTVTIDHPMEVPGGTILQPGTYVFRIVDQGQGASNRDIVRINNADDTKMIATFIAIPDYRLQRTDQPILEYKEQAAGQPNAMRAWFYAGEVGGLEFVYPRKRAAELAQSSQEYVPAEANETTGQDMNNAQLEAINPQGTEESMEQAYTQRSQTPVESAQATPSEPAAPMQPNETPMQPTPSNPPAQELPHTASTAPFAGLLGLTFLAVGISIRQLVKPKF
jgi:hypothetical protein